ncbi:LysR family transcriptional regulator [Pseudomonas sp. PA15(2017)]|uniref:LysR substrate-binding domain-containing protein n=1 Tax=Pseudomonas sp. PA15(2017) TaxID=1932111 RepID=UPI00096718E4|nr:LysR substrate-binding domain-containing protein [Pseudomonas sp. PA15(2017)]OLU22218.1 LysR family transcriptional regulator [Pseudomonas sp. PA15(2017)]
MLFAELKSFHMVARLGSITQAAKKLGLSQPTVTSQIRNLEAQYGVELFYRGGRRFALSEEGARLLPMVKSLLQQEADIEFNLRNGGQLQGSLRIAATAPYYVLELVRRFRERLPPIQVMLETGNSLQVIEALEEYRVDLAASSQLEEDSRFTRLRLGEDPLVLAVHRSHMLANHRSLPPSALAGHCLLMREVGSITRQLTEQMLRQAGVAPGVLLEIGSRESIREAVLRNIGITVIARHEVPDHPDLRVITLDGAPLIPEYLYCLRERRQARLPAAFLAIARECTEA